MRKNKLILRLREFLLTLGFIAGVSACEFVPQEVSITTLTGAAAERADNAPYAGFTGITEANTLSANKVQIKWSASTDEKVIAYNIYDSSNFFFPKLLKTVLAPANSFTLTGLTTVTLGTFRVKAATAKNVEDDNMVDKFAIPYGGIASATVTSSTTATVNFADISNADSAGVYCKWGTATDFTLVKSITNTVGVTSADLTGLLPGSTYTCRVNTTIADFTDNNTLTVSFIPIGQATRLQFVTEPGSAPAGTALGPQPVIRILDDNDNLVSSGPDSTALITLTLSALSPSAGTIRGTATIAAVGGVATFSGINFQEAGVKILTATKQDTSNQTGGAPSLTKDSSEFTIVPAAVSPLASKLTLTPASVPGSYLIANGNASYTVGFELADQYQNPISGVKPQFASTNSNDTLSQPVANTDSAGLTSGSISTTVAGTRTLSISSPSGLTAVTASATFVAGVATKVGFVQQPLNSPAGVATMNSVQAAVLDIQGNVVITSSANISLSIFNNVSGANLTGTTTVQAVNGVATFNGLGIDRIGTYKLIANSAPLTVAYSNNFQIVSGAPAKLALSGPSSFVSGNCSNALAFTLQLQDIGNNAANATASTVIQLTGTGGGGFYTSCAGTTPVTSVTYSTGSNTKTLYFKNQKAESLVLTARDPSLIMAQGTHNLTVTPSQVSLTGPTSIISGRCSPAFTITTLGADGTTGNVKDETPFQISGTLGSATFWEDSACTNSPVTNLSSFKVAAGQSTKAFYVKDPLAETISLTISDPANVISPATAPVVVLVNASQINFVGPTVVISGQPSSPYTVTLMDSLGNPVQAPQNVTLNISGLTGTQAAFYSNPAATTFLGSAFSIPQGAASQMIYLKDMTAESISVKVVDPAGNLADSATIQIKISPSGMTLAGPVPANSKTNICAGPFTLRTIDGAGNAAGAVTPITAGLTGAGYAGKFFNDSACSNEITQVNFAEGVSTRTFYFRGLYPDSSSFLASDSASPPILTPAQLSWTVSASPGWIGSGLGRGAGGTATETEGSPILWQSGKTPVVGRIDAPTGVNALAFDPSKRYLYVADANYHRVIKYDYQTNQYIGWLGMLTRWGGVGPTGANTFALSSSMGSTAAASLANQCITLAHNYITPGWCQGGMSVATGSITSGGMHSPNAVASDGNYVYVSNSSNYNITRFNANTGQFTGWVGRIGNNSGLSPGIDTEGNSLMNCSSSNANNSPTPGWCRWGGHSNSYIQVGTSPGLTYSMTIATDQTGETYLYTGNYGMVSRINLSTGAFSGWIGWVQLTSTGAPVASTLASAPGATNTCATTAANNRTPGWCIGGQNWMNGGIGAGGMGAMGGVWADEANNILYSSMGNNGGTIYKHNLTTGAYIGNVTFNNSPMAFNGIAHITFDGTYFYIADTNRIAKVDTNGTLWGWIGKVNTTASLANASGNPSGTCSTVGVNSNTTGWCMGGTAKFGIDETSFFGLGAIAYDGADGILVGQGTNFPAIKKFDKTTGNYQGMLVNVGDSPATWTDSQAIAGLHGFDDNSMYAPSGLHFDAGSNNLYATEVLAGRVKQIDARTGATTGWVGAVGGFVSGITRTLGCGTNSIGVTSGWCLGAMFHPSFFTANSWTLAPTNAGGFMYYPAGVTSDGTFLYVTDIGYNRINRFRLSDGAYRGWIGGISGTATTGPATASDSASCTNAVNRFTPGWCVGGLPTSGNGNGYLNSPSAITFASGNLYVIDQANHRVSSYNANTGAFNGWIGRVNSGTGISPATVTKSGWVLTNGWSTGGNSTNGSCGSDPGGGFCFNNGRGGIASDGVKLYVANTQNSRVDMFTLATGVYEKSSYTHPGVYTNVWTTTPNFGNNLGPASLAFSNGHLYYTVVNGTTLVGKMNATTGTVLGWRGGIGTSPAGPVSSPDCVGATGVTPDWCQGGGAVQGLLLGNSNNIGGFAAPYGITVDNHFVYISDENSHRITRYPK